MDSTIRRLSLRFLWRRASLGDYTQTPRDRGKQGGRGRRRGARYAEISLDGIQCPRRGAARIDGIATRLLPRVRAPPQGGPNRREVKNLDRAGQTFELLIAEFHFSMFCKSEIEYDIYHSAYEQWRMKELATFVKDSLSAAARTAEVLRRETDKKRQFRISVTLGALTTLTIIGATANIFSLSRSEWENLEIAYHPFRHVENMEGYLEYHPITILVFLICLVIFIVICCLNLERVASDLSARELSPRRRPWRRRKVEAEALSLDR